MHNPDDRTAAISARLDAASPEPWTVAISGASWRVLTGTEAAGFHLVCETGSTRNHDAELIANAPKDLAWLLFERGRLMRAMKSIAALEGIGGDIARKALAGKPTK